MSQSKVESGVNAKLFGKPETTAFRRYALVILTKGEGSRRRLKIFYLL